MADILHDPLTKTALVIVNGRIHSLEGTFKSKAEADAAAAIWLETLKPANGRGRHCEDGDAAPRGKRDKG